MERGLCEQLYPIFLFGYGQVNNRKNVGGATLLSPNWGTAAEVRSKPPATWDARESRRFTTCSFSFLPPDWFEKILSPPCTYPTCLGTLQLCSMETGARTQVRTLSEWPLPLLSCLRHGKLGSCFSARAYKDYPKGCYAIWVSFLQRLSSLRELSHTFWGFFVCVIS